MCRLETGVKLWFIMFHAGAHKTAVNLTGKGNQGQTAINRARLNSETRDAQQSKKKNGKTQTWVNTGLAVELTMMI